jgi:hypothetical protein
MSLAHAGDLMAYTQVTVDAPLEESDEDYEYEETECPRRDHSTPANPATFPWPDMKVSL